MTVSPPVAPTQTELRLEIRLCSQITAQRPTARAERGPALRPLDEDTVIGIITDAPCSMRLRLAPRDRADEPIVDPPWTLRVTTREQGGSWTSLPDRSWAEVDHVTDAHPITDRPRIYRLQVALTGTTLSATYEFTVGRVDPAAATSGDHDVLYDPQDDLKPEPKPVGSGAGATASGSLIASG